MPEPVDLRHEVCKATGGHQFEQQEEGWMATECTRCGYELPSSPTIEDYLRQRAEEGDDDIT